MLRKFLQTLRYPDTHSQLSEGENFLEMNRTYNHLKARITTAAHGLWSSPDTFIPQTKYHFTQACGRSQESGLQNGDFDKYWVNLEMLIRQCVSLTPGHANTPTRQHATARRDTAFSRGPWQSGEVSTSELLMKAPTSGNPQTAMRHY
ncbi:hypothetical protein B0H16DRAFT_1455159 [Mycena metata]|uniref:Uncharacterized protein n=1 Tax=Mycena metata TaxID=1033252 RepID=A0AAD7JEM1_9AGAR|nr:hypothetical protein B0H16DRAFT_1455159 [Mycena metata]